MATTSEDFAIASWDSYIGQEKMKARLDILLQAALKTDAMPEHMLLVAPPGYGKTSLAKLIAERIYEDFAEFTMPMNEKDFLWFIGDWTCGGIMLIDEIHAASSTFLLLLMQAMHDGKIITSSGREISTTHITFIGATTSEEEALLPPPLLERFRVQPVFEEYTNDEIARIIIDKAALVGLDLDLEAAMGLAKAAGGRPRLAGSLVTKARDLQTVGLDVTVESVLDLEGVDEDGLSRKHIHYIEALHELGDVAGATPLANMLGMKAGPMQTLERLLVRGRFIRMDPQGRTLTAKGMNKLPSAAPVTPTSRGAARAARAALAAKPAA